MKIFVYGTLKRNNKGNRFLGALKAQFLGDVRTPPNYILIKNSNTNIPYLIEGGTTAVHGELYEIDENIVEILDEYESYYQRKEIALFDGQKAFAYIAPLQLIENGIF